MEPENRPNRSSSLTAALGRGLVRWRWFVVAGWVALAVAAVAALPSLASVVQNDNAAFLPANAPSVVAQRLADSFAGQGTETGVLVVVGQRGLLTGADLAAVTALEHRVRAVRGVTSVESGALADDHEAYTVLLEFAGATDGGGAAGARAVAQIRADIAKVLPAGVSGYLTGSLPILVDQQHAAGRTAETVGLLSALVILVLLGIALRGLLAPVLALAPAGVALVVAGPVVAESTRAGVQISSLLQLLLTALVLGAGTDYAIFVVFRYREALGRGRRPNDAVVDALIGVSGTVVFSAATVVVALGSLLLARFGLYRGVGPGLAIGVVVVLVAELTLLPALLAVGGRWVFWPSRPVPSWATPGGWGRLAVRVCRRPVTALVAGVVCLGGLSLFVLAYAPSGFNPGGTIPGSGSALGAAALEVHFGISTQASDPTEMVFVFARPVWNDPIEVATAQSVLEDSGTLRGLLGPLNASGLMIDPGELATLHRELGPPGALPVVQPAGSTVPNWLYDAYQASAEAVSPDGHTVLFRAELSAGSSGSTAAMQAIPSVRRLVASAARASGASAHGVTGQAAAAADVSSIAAHDVGRIVPIVLLVLFLLLAIGLRSLVAPTYLVATVALSFLASLGLAVALFVVLGGELGVNFALPFFLFVFVMALGEDYNILVVRRIREESASWAPREAVSRAIAVTGSTVTTAGLVLASTFGVLAVTTSGQVQQIGAGLALGILLDTFVVRTLLVPAIAILVGRVNWWPSRLARMQPSVSPSAPVFDWEPGRGVRRRRVVPWGALGALGTATVLAATLAVLSSTVPPGATTPGAPAMVATHVASFETHLLFGGVDSCSSSGWCLALASGPGDWEILVTTGRSWRDAGPVKASLDPQYQPVVSCPAVDECVVGSGARLAVLTGPGLQWQAARAPERAGVVTGISCPTPSFCVAALISDNSTWLLASHDGGRSWQQRGWVSGRVEDLTCPSAGDCVAAIATVERAGTSADLERSSDGGRSFQVLRALGSGASVEALACPTDTTCWVLSGIEVGTEHESILARTVDAGASWAPVSLPSGPNAFDALTCSSANVCLLAGSVFDRTTDGGTTWQPVAGWLGEPPFAVVPSCAQRACIATTLNADEQFVLASSVDAGATWRVVTDARGVGEFQTVTCGTVRVCEVSAMQPAGVLRTVDGGSRWRLLALSAPPDEWLPLSCGTDGWCGALVVDGSGADLVAPGTPGATRLPVPSSSATLSLSCWRRGRCVVVASNLPHGLLLATTDGGRTWAVRSVAGSEPVAAGVSCAARGFCLAYLTGGVGNHPVRVLASDDGGIRWSPVSSPTATGAVEDLWCDPATCLAVSLFASPGTTVESVASTSDGGRTWQQRPLPAGDARFLVDAGGCVGGSSCWLELGTPRGPLLVSTTTAGATWIAAPLAASLRWVTQVTCPQVDRCLAIGFGRNDEATIDVLAPAS